MDKYDKFEVFIRNIIETANKEYFIKHKEPINKLFNIEQNAYNLTLSIISNNWNCFSALAVIMSLTTVSAYCKVDKIFESFSTTEFHLLKEDEWRMVLLSLCKNNAFVLAIKKIGEQTMEEFNNHINEKSYLDVLTKKKVELLIASAR